MVVSRPSVLRKLTVDRKFGLLVLCAKNIDDKDGDGDSDGNGNDDDKSKYW